MIYFAICDDDELFISEFRKSLSEYEKMIDLPLEVQFCNSGTELMELFQVNDIDTVFLDIDMPDMDGFQIAKQIKTTHPECIIVFCSNHNELVYDSFEYEPFWFLCKDNYESKLYLIFKKLISKIQMNKEEFIVKIKEELLRLKYNEILYVTVCKHNIQLHQKNNLLEYRGNLSSIEHQFLQRNFIKINSGCLVNLDAIYRITDNELILNNEEVLIVSRSRKKDVKEMFFTYLERK